MNAPCHSTSPRGSIIKAVGKDQNLRGTNVGTTTPPGKSAGSWLTQSWSDAAAVLSTQCTECRLLLGQRPLQAGRAFKATNLQKFGIWTMNRLMSQRGFTATVSRKAGWSSVGSAVQPLAQARRGVEAALLVLLLL